MSDEQQILLQRIDAAIERLELLPTTPTIASSLANLHTKRVWVVSGQYVVRQVNEELVACIGREIALWTQAYGVNAISKRDKRCRTNKKQHSHC